MRGSAPWLHDAKAIRAANGTGTGDFEYRIGSYRLTAKRDDVVLVLDTVDYGYDLHRIL